MTLLRPSMVQDYRLVLLLNVLLAAYAAPVPLWAQLVRGQVVDSTSGVPVGTGFVVLLDRANHEVARALSTSDGRFTLHAPSGGLYRLRSERIGYHAHESPLLPLPADTTVVYTLKVIAFPVMLGAVEVRGDDECQTNPEHAAATAVVWEEVRKALAATAWDGTQQLVNYRSYSYERDLSIDLNLVSREEGHIVAGPAVQPYASLPAAQLAREGYVATHQDGATSYYLPDARVLLDEAFLSTHCFHVIRDTVPQPGQLGLAFEPVSDRAISDVRGVLWLDEATSQLLTLEVTFTNLPEGVQDPRAGGTVDFMQLPSGAWIVQRWQVRTPHIEPRRVVEQFVTIVVISKRGLGAARIDAIYDRGRRYPIGGPSGIRLGDSVATSIPWHPGGLAFRTVVGARGRARTSREIFLEPGQVFVVKFPEYFMPGGLLYRFEPQ